MSTPHPVRPALQLTAPAVLMSVLTLGPALTVGFVGTAQAADPAAAADGERWVADPAGDDDVARRPGAWSWPLHPRPSVVRTFEAPLGPYGAGHRGIDLAASVGAPARAAVPGRVAFAGQVGGRPVVVVDHGRLRTTYEPVMPLLRRGAAVAAGDVVGTVVLPGSHCLPLACLHFGVRDGDTYLDPLRFFPARPVRLLPGVPHGSSAPAGYLPVVPPGLML
jgi:murein DD-endopeptidase MepM/ murein hydrolase activator NlpD